MEAVGAPVGLLLVLVQRLPVVVVITLAVVVVVLAQVLEALSPYSDLREPECRNGASSSKGRKPTGSPDA